LVFAKWKKYWCKLKIPNTGWEFLLLQFELRAV